MKHLQYLFFFLTFLVFYNLNAQHSNTVLGDYIVRLDEGVDVNSFTREISENNNTSYQLNPIKCLSNNLNIWLLHSNTNDNTVNLLNVLKRNKQVHTVQLNHIIENRTNIPNDPQFNQQWPLLNDGSVGLENADLDNELAWDITTGGLNPKGDTIVVCVIDDGIDLYHEDLESNIWRNHQEIPNNNIDDDNNGFVDDYLGWNAYTQEDNVGLSAWHGTPTAGIIGAKGNNNTGISGVNWEIQLMIVKGGGNEADAIAAYDYPLEMRKLYNNTNGAKGAFVVATNTSWGVNGLHAEEAPIWCALYDSLGSYGVLNCAATANNEVDVELSGDMPTTCTSDYLISVTNINRFDEKVIEAAYGAESIDLGAYGELSYTTAYNNTYNTFGGTSAATPHVTGTIGLLYSAPCLSFAELSIENPAEAALLMKEYILQGTVSNESVESITVSEGRLNTHNSLQLLLQDCLDDSCFPPYGLEVNTIAEDSAHISWNVLEADSFLLSFRPQGNISWSLLHTQNNFYDISELESCSYYEYIIQSYCGNELSDYTSIKNFKTLGCCDTPKQLSADYVTENTIQISWNEVNAAENYLIRIASENTTWVEYETFPDNTFEFTNLEACTEYTIEVESICDDDTEIYKSTIKVYTKDCGSCRDTAYCLGALPDNLSFDWISRIELNDAIYESESNAYSLTSDTNITVNINAAYELKLSSVTEQNDFFLKSYGAWIDFNHDGVFDADESILNIISNKLEVNQEFFVPNNAIIGTTRMRVVLNNYESASPCNNLAFGEIEDYCINISDDTQVDEYEGENESINIFPNPAHEKISIRLPEKWLLNNEVSIRIFNAFGQLVCSHSNKSELIVHTNNYAKGIYSVVVEDEDSIIGVSKLIIY